MHKRKIIRINGKFLVVVNYVFLQKTLGDHVVSDYRSDIIMNDHTLYIVGLRGSTAVKLPRVLGTQIRYAKTKTR
jgi:hypothetical protein